MRTFFLVSLFTFSLTLVQADSYVDQFCNTNTEQLFAQKPLWRQIRTETRVRGFKEAELQKKVFYNFEPVESPPHGILQNSFFKVTRGKSNKALLARCENLEASNVFYHLNRVNQFILNNPYVIDPIKLSPKKAIVVRVGINTKWTFWGKYSEEEEYNGAYSYCDYFDPIRKKMVYEQEIWFLKPRQVKDLRKKWLPVCALGILNNWGVCEREVSNNFALLPVAIYHEYFHLLTQKYLSRCHKNSFDEAISNVLASVFEGTDSVGGNVPGSVISPSLQIDFRPRRLSKVDLDDFYHSTSSLTGVFLKITKDLKLQGFSKQKIVALFLNSVFHLKDIDLHQSKQNQYMDMAQRLIGGCQDFENSQDCKSTIESNLHYFD